MLRALLLDAGGTLLQPSEPVAASYARIGHAHGVRRTPEAIAVGFREAFAAEREGPRYVGDARPFWREVVRHATGSADPAYFEAVYTWFARPEAWRIAPGAREVCVAFRAAGGGVAVVSNWDTRLRPLLDTLGVCDWTDATVISAEVGVEKPDPAIFRHACRLLDAEPAEALHVGDDERLDVRGAQAAGCRGLLFGRDVSSFWDLPAHLGILSSSSDR